MSIARMKRLRLLALISDRDKILHDLLLLGCVEITEPDKLTPELMSLIKRDESMLSQLNANYNRINSVIKTLKTYAKIKKSFLVPRPALSESAFFDQNVLNRALKAAQDIEAYEKNLTLLLGEAGRMENKRASLLPWQSLDSPLDAEGFEDCPVLLGTCPASEDLGVLNKKLKGDKGLCSLYLISSDREQHYLFLICHKSGLEEAMEILKGSGFAPASFKDTAGTVKDNLAIIDDGLKNNLAKREETEKRLKDMGSQLGVLEHASDMLGVFINIQSSRERLFSTGKVFYLEGWMLDKKRPAVEKMLSQYISAAEISDPQEGDNVPVKLDNSPLVASMSMVTEMYSLPAYGTIDPNPLIFPFFPIFFGIMYADIGYGAILCAISMIVLKKKNPGGMMGHAFKLLGICGFTTLVFGVLFGGFFGDVITVVAKSFFNADVILPAFLFNPLERPMEMLYLALAIGVVQIITGMLIKVYMLVRDGKPWDALMDVGSWFLLFAGLAVFYFNGTYYVALAGVAALVLTQGRRSKNVFGKFFSGIASLYNITSYLSDVLSYLRLMALCLATTVIASVVNTLGTMAGIAGFIIVFAVGHAFNMGINIIGTFVHASRLQYLEYFSKFFVDGGKPFKPLEINTKYVDVLKGEQ